LPPFATSLRDARDIMMLLPPLPPRFDIAFAMPRYSSFRFIDAFAIFRFSAAIFIISSPLSPLLRLFRRC
jgi:hypothetical protein